VEADAWASDAFVLATLQDVLPERVGLTPPSAAALVRGLHAAIPGEAEEA
jgi:hypothetical protein